MRLLKVFLAAAVFPLAAFAEGTAQRGIEVGDLNRGVEPCSDFYEYANGQWRANNPIPPSMVLLVNELRGTKRVPARPPPSRKQGGAVPLRSVGWPAMG